MPSEEAPPNLAPSRRANLKTRVRRARTELERTRIEAHNAKVEYKKWKKLYKRAKKAVKRARAALEELEPEASRTAAAERTQVPKRRARAKSVAGNRESAE